MTAWLSLIRDFHNKDYVQIESTELPYLFRTTLDSIPCEVPYICIEESALGITTKKANAGLCWCGGSFDPRRAMHLSDLEPLIRVPEVSFFQLQRGRQSRPGVAWRSAMLILSQADRHRLWAPVLQTVIGALIGTTGAIARGVSAAGSTWQKERQSVAAAFAGKVQGFTVNWRGIREFILRGYKSPSTIILFPCSRLMLGRLDYCTRTSLAKVAGFTATPGE